MQKQEIINLNEQVEELYNFVVFLSALGQTERDAVRFMPIDYHPFVVESVRERIRVSPRVTGDSSTGSLPVYVSSENVNE